MTNSAPERGTWQMLRSLLPWALRGWPALLAVVLTGLTGALLGLLAPWPVKVVIDYVLRDETRPPWLRFVTDLLPGAQTPSGLLGWTVAAGVLLFVLGWAASLASSYAGLMLRERITYALAGDVFAKISASSARLQHTRGTGDLIRRTMVDSECVAVVVVGTAVPMAVALFTVSGVFGVMWAINPPLLLCALAVVPATALALRHFTPLMTERSLQQQNVEGELYNDLEQTLTAMPVVQAFGAEQRMQERFVGGTSRLLDATLATTAVQMRFRAVVGSATALATAAIFLLGGQAVLDGRMTLGDIVLFLAYLGALYSPVNTLMFSTESLQYAAGSARRVLEVLESAPDVVDRPGARTLGEVRGRVSFQNVSFGYDPKRPVLQDVSFEALPGQTVALVGPSGAGKTTLASLLPRFYDPDSGRILLDGHDLRDLTLTTLRAHISLVLQDPFLFPISLADNIAYGRPDATREQVVDAAVAANADTFIRELPEGYDTVVGERGSTLSGGQRQRISIARALLKDAPLLILDEPTSALDTSSERLLLQALDRLMTGRTTFIIAHRLSTIRNADQILVLNHGRIVERGTHRELRDHRGLYADLVRTLRPTRRRRAAAVT